jgi:hypothetical protein
MGTQPGDIVATSAAAHAEDVDAGTSPRHRPKENTMPSRLPEWLTRHRRASKIVITAAALTGLGITGATAASAVGASSHPASHPASHARASTSDPDNVQSGDQTTPDTTADGEQSDGPDTDNIQSGPQSGDQSGPETPDSGGNR